jgi:hypothetical protein
MSSYQMGPNAEIIIESQPKQKLKHFEQNERKKLLVDFNNVHGHERNFSILFWFISIYLI